jgi:hypothetical protein
MRIANYHYETSTETAVQSGGGGLMMNEGGFLVGPQPCVRGCNSVLDYVSSPRKGTILSIRRNLVSYGYEHFSTSKREIKSMLILRTEHYSINHRFHMHSRRDAKLFQMKDIQKPN